MRLITGMSYFPKHYLQFVLASQDNTTPRGYAMTSFGRRTQAILCVASNVLLSLLCRKGYSTATGTEDCRKGWLDFTDSALIPGTGLKKVPEVCNMAMFELSGDLP